MQTYSKMCASADCRLFANDVENKYTKEVDDINVKNVLSFIKMHIVITVFQKATVSDTENE